MFQISFLPSLEPNQYTLSLFTLELKCHDTGSPAFTRVILLPFLSDKERPQSIAAEELLEKTKEDPMAKIATAKIVKMLILFIRLSIRPHRHLIHGAYPHNDGYANKSGNEF